MEKIYDENLLDDYRKYSAIYGIESNLRRNMPDARDGLKLVQRRIIHCMFNKQQCATRDVKTVAVVGEVTKIHPHGDASIGGAIKPLCNWFDVKCPIISTKSNMGNMQGASAAATRYTEIRLSEFGLDCVISDMRTSKQSVDWVPTFDNTDMEPEYLPTAVPLLLINGATGIGFGYKTHIPTHNLIEVIDATINLIKHPNASVLLIPDQCMPCEIIDTNWKAISNKGHGAYKVRGIIDIEDNKGSYNLIIKSTPNAVSWNKGSPEKGGIKYDILNMVKDGKLPQIKDIVEDSHGGKVMRSVIKLREGSDPNYVKEMIYKNTEMQKSFTVNFNVLKGLELVRMSYKSYLQLFIEERKICKFRSYCSKLQNTRTKLHEKDAYVKVMESGEIDNIINMIKKQKTIDDTAIIEYIIKHTGITDIQAKFIINSNIKNLSMAYLNKYKEDLKELKRLDTEYINKITNDDTILQDIIDELNYFKKKYGQPRVCKIISQNEIDNIPSGEFKIIITENGYIKKMAITDNIGAKNGDNPVHVLRVDNTDNVILFTENGKVFKLPVHKIHNADKNSVGYDLRILVKGLMSKIIDIIPESLIKDLDNKVSKHFLVMVTKNNCIKKLDLKDVSNVPPSGIIFTKLNEGDLVKDIKIVNNSLDIIIYSNKKALRIPMKDVSHYKRQAVGVAAMNTKYEIDGLEPLYKDATHILVITKNGKFNKFDISGLSKSARGKAGSSVINLTKGDSIHSIFGVNDNNVLRITTKQQRLEINISDIKIGSSISQGNKLIPTRGDIIIKCSILKK